MHFLCLVVAPLHRCRCRRPPRPCRHRRTNTLEHLIIVLARNKYSLKHILIRDPFLNMYVSIAKFGFELLGPERIFDASEQSFQMKRSISPAKIDSFSGEMQRNFQDPTFHQDATANANLNPECVCVFPLFFFACLSSDPAASGAVPGANRALEYLKSAFVEKLLVFGHCIFPLFRLVSKPLISLCVPTFFPHFSLFRSSRCTCAAIVHWVEQNTE